MEKRVLKTEPRLNVDLNAEQKEVAKLIYEHDIVFILGTFGTGKSLTATHTALTMFRKKQFNKIWITRPIIKNNLGILPGSIDEKLNPYIYPLVQNLEVCQGKELTQKMRDTGLIEIMPLDVCKGVTFMDSIVIVDEFQDMKMTDFRTICSRLGKTSKMVFCGSIEQIDASIGHHSCIHEIQKLRKWPKVGYKVLESDHRNLIVRELFNYLENNGTTEEGNS